MREECLQRSALAQDHHHHRLRQDTTPPPAPLPSERLPPSTTSNSEPSYPYDAWVLAGGRLFRAHAHVLGTHSPYLRASINALGEARLLLPHIPPGGFSAILSYMYTGRLSLTQAPLYETLLTGHLLQMPGIVALCQALLASPLPHGSHSNFYLPPPPPPPPPDESHGVTGLSPTEGALPQALRAWQNLARLVPTTAEVPTPSVQPTLIRPTPTRPFRTQAHDNVHTEPETSTPVTPTHLLHVDKYTFCPSLKPGSLNPSRESLRQAEDEKNHSNSSSVVLDIAACDGPVFFERVVNKAFKSQHSDGCENSSDSDDSEINVVDTGGNEAPPFLRGLLTSLKNQPQPPIPNPAGGSRIYHCVYCNNNFKSHYCYQKHMRRHINPITVEETETVDETSRETTSLATTRTEDKTATECEGPTSSSNVTRQQLRSGPSTSGSEDDPTNGNDRGTASGAESYSSNSSGGRKLRVLDLNVQYFPCKTCGSKFPSYYFVHKHRRMCHREEEEMMERGKSGNQSPTSSCDSPTNTPSNSMGGDQQPSSDTNEDKI